MHKYLLIALFFTVFSLSAQKEPANFDFGIGPNLSLKTSISYVETPDGRKNAVGIAELPTFGLTAYLPFNDKNRIGSVIELNYETYSYQMESYETGIKLYNTHNYFSITPQLYFSNFLLGVNIGIPMDIKIEGNDDAEKDIMNTTLELVFGGMFNIYNDNTGRIDFFLKGQFMFTGIYEDFSENDPLQGTFCSVCPLTLKDKNNPKLGSVQLGFVYMFNLNQ